VIRRQIKRHPQGGSGLAAFAARAEALRRGAQGQGEALRRCVPTLGLPEASAGWGLVIYFRDSGHGAHGRGEGTAGHTGAPCAEIVIVLCNCSRFVRLGASCCQTGGCGEAGLLEM